MFIRFSSRKMKKAIFYKEWIKTRRYTLLALILSLIFVGYALLQLQRVIGFKGVGHLWEILLSRDTVRCNRNDSN